MYTFYILNDRMDGMKLLAHIANTEGRKLPRAWNNARSTLIERIGKNQFPNGTTYIRSDIGAWTTTPSEQTMPTRVDIALPAEIQSLEIKNRHGVVIHDPKVVFICNGDEIAFDFLEVSDESKDIGYFMCDDCCAIIDSSELNLVDTKRVCKSCFERHAPCKICGELTRNTVWTVDSDGDSLYIHAHERCMERSADWRRCINCGTYFQRTEDDNGYCPKCKYAEYAHEYFYKPDPIFHNLGNEPVNNGTRQYFGVEIEMEYDEDCEETDFNYAIYQTVKDRGEFYAKHDGSLDSGEEFVTHPMTLPYIMENDIFGKFFASACDNGFHAESTCGIHVHCNRAYFDNDPKVIANILLMLDFNYEDVISFSRRAKSRLDQWASILRYYSRSNDYKYDDRWQEDDIVHKAKAYGRYTALNVQNSNTIEFRIFNGTDRADYCQHCVEFCKIMIDFAMSHTSDECSYSTFATIFDGASDCFKSYCKKMGIAM